MNRKASFVAKCGVPCARRIASSGAGADLLRVQHEEVLPLLQQH